MHQLPSWLGLLLLLHAFVSPAVARAQDSVEFLNGSKLEGKLVEIRKDAKEFDFHSQIAGQEITRTYLYSKVHAVTFGGKRFVLTAKPDQDLTFDSKSRSSATERDTQSAASPSVPKRTKSEVMALINDAGQTPPDWYKSTQVNPPPTLDLDWPLKPEGKWDSAKNVGQYIWDRVNPNEGRWRAGIKLVHECMARQQGDAALLRRDAEKLGVMYFTLLQDYARAAFWLQTSKASVRLGSGIHLAECYWRLGNKQLALSAMRGKILHVSAIKLLGDMGQIDDALAVAAVYSKTQAMNEAFLNAGDALRRAGRLEEAVAYYQRVLDSNSARNEDYKKRFQARAAGAIEAIRLFDRAHVTRVADGTYDDSSTGYNGKLAVSVKIANRRIESVKVTEHREKQFYAALTDTPKQIIELQSIRGIDGTSGATITSQAIVHATARALAQGAE